MLMQTTSKGTIKGYELHVRTQLDEFSKIRVLKLAKEQKLKVAEKAQEIVIY